MIRTASADQLDQWLDRILDAETLVRFAASLTHW